MTGFDGATTPNHPLALLAALAQHDPELAALLAEVAAVTESSGPSGPSAVGPHLGRQRVRTLPLGALGAYDPALFDEALAVLTAVSTRVGEGPTPRADLSAVPDGQRVAALLHPDGTVERVRFPADDMDGFTEMIRVGLTTIRPGEPKPAGAKAVDLAADLVIWIRGYDQEPNPEFLATQAANLGATLLVFMGRDGLVPIFGPVVLTGNLVAAPPAGGARFHGLSATTAGLLDVLALALSPGTDERFGPAFRELAGRGSYLQDAVLTDRV